MVYSNTTKAGKHKALREENEQLWLAEGVHTGMVCGRGQKGTEQIMEDIELPARNCSKHRGVGGGGGTMEQSQQGERENCLGPCALRIIE